MKKIFFIFVLFFMLFHLDLIAQKYEEYNIKPIAIHDVVSRSGIAFFETNKLIYTQPKRDEDIHDLDFHVVLATKSGGLNSNDLFENSVNSYINEIDIVYTNDFKKAYFTRSYIDANKKEHFDIYVADISESKKFINIKALPINYRKYSTSNPCLSKDNKVLYFASNRLESIGGFDIFKVELPVNGGRFGKVVNLGNKVNTKRDEITPFINDGQLYYASNGKHGLGGFDVFSIDLTSMNKPINLGESFNSVNNEYGYIRKPNNNFGYFISDRNGKNNVFYFTSHEIAPPIEEIQDDIVEVVEEKPNIVNEYSTGDIIEKVNSAVKEKNKNNYSSENIEIANSKKNEDRLSEISKSSIPKKANKENFNKNSISKIKTRHSHLKNRKRKTLLEKRLERKKQRELLRKKELEKLKNNTVVKIEKSKINKIEEPKIAKVNKSKTKEEHLKVKSKVKEKSKESENLDKIKEIPKKKITNKKEDNFKELPTSTVIASIPKYEEKIIYEKKIDRAENVYDYQRRIVYSTTNVKVGRVRVEREAFTKKEKKCLGKIELLNNIYFNLNKFTIRPDAQIELNRAIRIMEKCPNLIFVASSFTDSRGSSEYNRKLSQRRADAVVSYILANSNIPARRIEGVGYGESGLKNHCYNGVKCSDREHQVNRRTEIEVSPYR